MNTFIEKHNKHNFCLITINFHPSDMDSFNTFLNSIFLPYVIEAPLYALTTEFNESLSRHLHCVVGYDKNFARDIDKIKTKLNGKKIKKILSKVYNTDECGFDIKPLQDNTSSDDEDKDTKFGHVYTTIGYCIKQGTRYLQTNIKDEKVLEQCRIAYIDKVKKPIVQLENNYEHKQLSKGNILNYIYDASIKHPNIPIVQLENYTIKHMKYSYISISSQQKKQAFKELNIIRSEDDKIHDKYDNQDKYDILPIQNQYDYESESFNTLKDFCIVKDQKIKQYEELFDKIAEMNKYNENEKLSKILNEKYYFI